jgi:dihydrodipicolinate synthase/N-acetylneuraminate lyase
MKSHEEIREALTGPVPSISTPFLENGDIDYKTLSSMIHFYIDSGMKTILLTPGDSLYFCLSDAEIAELTRFTAQEANGKTMLIAGDQNASTNFAVNFAEYSKEVGVDLYITLPADWCNAMTPETCSDHYAAVGKVMPTMILTCALMPMGDAKALKTLEMSMDKSSGIAAIKDDYCGAFSRKMSLLCYERLAIIAGGQKQNHLSILPYGVDGYLSVYARFKPEIAWKYWDAITRNDIPAAVDIISKYDFPFFKETSQFAGNGNFDLGIRAAMEVFGICKRWRPKPFRSADDKDVASMREFFEQLDLI